MKDLKVIENELVPVYVTSTGEKVVYGSELHAVLGSPSVYREWVKRRLSDVCSTENEDYTTVEISTVSGGTPKKDHIIKLDTAKEMAMLERNEKGKQVRQYFIKIEKKYKASALDTSQLSPELQMFKKIFDTVAMQEIQQREQAEKLSRVEEKVNSIREVVALDTTSWRDDSSRILRKIGMELGEGKGYPDARSESYQLLERRAGVNLKQRLTNKRRRMAEEGACKSKRDKLNYLDIISDDKKLIEVYTAIVKEMAVRYGVA